MRGHTHGNGRPAGGDARRELRRAFGTTSVSGPGQNAAASRARSRRQRPELRFECWSRSDGDQRQRLAARAGPSRDRALRRRACSSDRRRARRTSRSDSAITSPRTSAPRRRARAGRAREQIAVTRNDRRAARARQTTADMALLLLVDDRRLGLCRRPGAGVPLPRGTPASSTPRRRPRRSPARSRRSRTPVGCCASARKPLVIGLSASPASDALVRNPKPVARAACAE